MNDRVLPQVIKRSAGWKPDSVVTVEARNTAGHMVNLKVIFAGRGNEVCVSIGIFPGWPARIGVPFKTAAGDRLFLARTPGQFKAVVYGANLAPDAIDEIRLDLPRGAREDVEVLQFKVESAMPQEYTYPGETLVDDLHQWRTRKWPGKAGSLDEVRAALDGELKAEAPGYPPHWSKYGGWQEKKFHATGWFRTENDGRRWWLVDPEGCAFWSMGPDCVRPTIETCVSDIERVFGTALPSRRDYPHLWSERKPWGRVFDAGVYNLDRVFGKSWRTKWNDLTRRRLVAGCHNTIGNWSDREFQRSARIPYVFTMTGWPQTKTLIFRDFPDVYSDEYARNAEKFAEQLVEIREDPFVIGYFMTNEPAWAFVSGLNLGLQTLRAEQQSATREALINFIAARYGEIGKLNLEWGTSFRQFEDLRKRVDIEKLKERAGADMLAFASEAIERYVLIPARACRAVDPNHLNLGLRWAWIHSDYQLAGADELDAFSINYYHARPDPATVATITSKTKKPLVIGEFHIGALDRGLPSGGIRNVAAMAESVKAYRYYIEQAASLPGLVGAHYFQWNDQHVMGRFDGENMQIGMVDITGRMYPEWMETCRHVHGDLYRVAAGEREPFNEPPALVERGTLCW